MSGPEHRRQDLPHADTAAIPAPATTGSGGLGLGWVLLAFGVYAACALGLWVAAAWRPEWDGSVYLLLAKSLAAGEGYLYQGEPFYLRPPGLPWMLSFLVREGTFDPSLVNRLLMGWGVASVLAIYFAIQGLHGRGTALVVALLSGTSLLFGQLFNCVFAEFPFVALTMVAIALLERSRTTGRAWWGWALAGGACLAGAILMRTVGVLVLPGVLLLPLLSRGSGGRLRGVLPVALAGLLVLPWMLHARSVAAEVEVPVEQDLLYDYATALFHVDPGDPDSPRVDLAGLLNRVRDNGSELLDDLTSATFHVPAHPLLTGLLVLLLLAGAVCALRRRGPTLLDWLALVYVPLIATYFVYDERLVMPLVPLVYLYLAALVQALVSRGGHGEGGGEGAARASRVAGAAALALVAVNVAALRPELASRKDTGAIGEEIARVVRAHTPPDARILCNQAPTVALATGRRTFTYRFLRSPDILEKYAIDYVLYDTAGTPLPLQQMVRERLVRRWPIPIGGGRRTFLHRIRTSGPTQSSSSPPE